MKVDVVIPDLPKLVGRPQAWANPPRRHGKFYRGIVALARAGSIRCPN